MKKAAAIKLLERIERKHFVALNSQQRYLHANSGRVKDQEYDRYQKASEVLSETVAELRQMIEEQ